MVFRLPGRRGKAVDDIAGSREVGIADAEVNKIDAPGYGLCLFPVKLGKLCLFPVKLGKKIGGELRQPVCLFYRDHFGHTLFR
jgi:hypothetical protein